MEKYYIHHDTVEFHTNSRKLDADEILDELYPKDALVTVCYDSWDDVLSDFEKEKEDCQTYTFVRDGLTILHADVIELREVEDDEDYAVWESFCQPYHRTIYDDYMSDYDESVNTDEDEGFLLNDDGSIVVRSWMYESLAHVAVKRGAPQKYINALGKWFDWYGMDFWNGECFKVDGKHDINLYPILAWDEDFENADVVGYSFDCSAQEDYDKLHGVVYPD